MHTIPYSQNYTRQYPQHSHNSISLKFSKEPPNIYIQNLKIPIQIL